MASRRAPIVREWDRAQARDLRDLPHEPRLVRPGSYGTFPERVEGSAPLAPTLDDGPLYTGEWREEIDGDYVDVPVGGSFVTLAALRRPWPYVGFAVDTSAVAPAGTSVRVGLLVLTRSGHARLIANVVGGAPLPAPEIIVAAPQAPFHWVTMSGIYVGARVAVYATATNTDDEEEQCTLRANLWGYNAPGFGP